MDDSSPLGSGSGQLHLQDFPGMRGGAYDCLMSPDNSYPLELDTMEEEVVTEDEYSDYKSGYRGSKHEKGTFWPEKPKSDPTFSGNVKASTVLTNLQRGNIPTIMQTVVEPVIMTMHQKSGQGELREAELRCPEATPDIDERDSSQRTPLMWAAAYGQAPTVSLLLRHGADINANGLESETALHLAATKGHHDVARILIAAGAAVDAKDENSCTPLMFAAMCNHPHVVNELLASGASLAQTNINGDSALALAIKQGSSSAQMVIENHLILMLKGLSDKDD